MLVPVEDWFSCDLLNSVDQLVAEKGALESFLLQRGRDAESEEDVEGAGRDGAGVRYCPPDPV